MDERKTVLQNGFQEQNLKRKVVLENWFEGQTIEKELNL
jgi:hypothetical protein